LKRIRVYVLIRRTT